MTGLAHVRRASTEVVDYRIAWRVEIVTKIDTNRSDWSLIAQPQTHRVREVIEVTGADRARDVVAGLLIGLPEAHKAGEHVLGILEDVAHVMEEDEAQVLSDIGQGEGRHTQLE